jgi:hypothetical protein
LVGGVRRLLRLLIAELKRKVLRPGYEFVKSNAERLPVGLRVQFNGPNAPCQCLARGFSSSTSHSATQLIERFASDDPAEVPSLDGTHRVERSKLDRPVSRILLIALILESRSDCFEPRMVGLSGQAVQGGVYTHLQVDHLPNCAHEHIEIVGVDGRAWNYPFRCVAGTIPEWHSDGNRRSNPRSWLVANQG